jgi:two-component system phosphate regulon sensor histidine kinase PhoR
MKKTFRFLIAISSIALAGIIFTQVYWVMNAVEMHEQSFDKQVSSSTKSVANRMFDYQVDLSSGSFHSPCDTTLFDEIPIIEILNPAVLDSLIKEEFSTMEPGANLVYGVYNTQDTSFLILDDKNYHDEILASNYQINLTCLYRPDIYMLSLYFTNKSQITMGSIYIWLTLSILFLTGIVLAYIFIIFNHLKQKRLSEMKSDFINNMTHEFKTPLSTISMASEMMLKPSINEYPYKVKRYANVVHTEMERLQHHVDHILHLASNEHEKMEIRQKPVQVNSVINQQIEHFKMKLEEGKGQISTDLTTENDEILADRDHLANVISNLIDNALKYTTAEPKIKICTRKFDNLFEISVADNGIGISKENQLLIFKKLFRVPTGDVHNVRGFGIGLYYVKAVIEAHGGMIRLQSEPGKGSTFTILMPYSQNN